MGYGDTSGRARTRWSPCSDFEYGAGTAGHETKHGVRGSWRDVPPIHEPRVTESEFEANLAPLLADLRGLLVARHGVQIGLDVHAEVAAFAWEQREALGGMENPGGYLFRVSQSRARRYRRWGQTITLPKESNPGMPTDTDPRLDEALRALNQSERTAVVLVHGYGYRYDEAAALLGWTSGAVRNRLHRGMTKLRRTMKERDPA